MVNVRNCVSVASHKFFCQQDYSAYPVDNVVFARIIMVSSLIKLLHTFLLLFVCDSIHDRKMFVLGFCALMDLPKEMRPQALLECSPQILPALLVLFSGLKRAYESKYILLICMHFLLIERLRF